jgi:hypothetical protein
MSLRYARNLTPTKDQYARRWVCECGHHMLGMAHAAAALGGSSCSHACHAVVLHDGPLRMICTAAAPCWARWGSAVGSRWAVWRHMLHDAPVPSWWIETAARSAHINLSLPPPPQKNPGMMWSSSRVA